MKRIWTILALVFIGVQATAQGDSTANKYGETPEQQEKCKTYLSLYREYRDQGNIKDAIPPWRKAWKICPKSAKTLYIDGADFYQHLVENTEDSVKKAAYVDTLMMVYDDRIKYFDQEGFVLGLKGNDLFKYDETQADKAFDYLQRAMEIEGTNTDAVVASRYYQALYKMYRQDKATKSELLTEYMPVVEILDYNIQRLEDDRSRSRYEKAKSNLDAFFVKIAECEDIYRILGESIENKPDDIELKKKALSVMNRRDCTEGELYLSVAEAVYENNPTHQAAYSIGIQKVKAESFSEALNYFEEAIDLCGKDDECLNRRQYLKRAGQAATLLGQTSKARSFANKMLEMNPNDGEAYMIIGDAVAGAADRCANDKLGKNAVYWLATDYYQKARSVDPEVADDANSKIAGFKKYYPSKKDAFFHGLEPGDKYTLECLGETTTVRTLDQ